MGSHPRPFFRTAIAILAVSLVLAGRLFAQPLVATVGIVDDVCAPPAPFHCTTGTLYLVNGETLQIHASMDLWRGTVGGVLQKLVAHPDGTLLYVGLTSASHLAPGYRWIDVVDLRTMTKVARFDVSGDLNAISADGTRLYLTAPSAVRVIDSGNGSAVFSIPLDSPSDIAIADRRGRLYVAGRTLPPFVSSIFVLDSTTHAQLATVPMTQSVSQLLVTPDESHLYALAPTSRVVDIDLASNTIAGVMTDFGGPTSPNALTFARDHLYVAASAQAPTGPGDGIAVIDAETRAFVTKIGVVDPFIVESSTDGSRVWTATLGEPRVITIETASNQRIGSVTVPGGPLDLAAIPPGRTAEMAIDQPQPGTVVFQPFSISGWAVDAMGVLPGPGVDAVHVWAYPAAGAAPLFVGADYGRPRPDVGAIFGATYTNSGYSVLVRGLAPGLYHLAAFAHSTRTGEFSIVRAVTVTVSLRPLLIVDTPGAGNSVEPRFTIAGWAIDEAAQAGTGIDAVHVWAYPADGGPPVFAGAATLGDARPDVASIFGPQFASAGYHLVVSSLLPGDYTLVVYGHSTVTGAFSVEQRVPMTVGGPTPMMAIDTPAPNATVGGTFVVAGWAAEFNAPAGTGVDLVHIWATPPTGAATFLGEAVYGFERPDVGAWLGSQYTPSGFALLASLPTGAYTVSVYARGTATGTFRNLRTVTIIVP